MTTDTKLDIKTLQAGIDEVRSAIMADSENRPFTEQGWIPIFQAFPEAKIVIVGPAPGIKTQTRRESFRDKSGDRLRTWMGVTEEIFYHSRHIAVLPLDFYFPGKAKTGDLPPRKGFAEKWHPKLLTLMPEVELMILVGLYSQKFYLKEQCKKTLTETVFSYEEFLPRFFPLVHPSPLNFRWLNKNPDFEKKIVPELKTTVKNVLNKK